METGKANAVICHQLNAKRVQLHHASVVFPPASSFVKDLHRDFAIPGISPEMVQSNQPISIPKSLGRRI